MRDARVRDARVKRADLAGAVESAQALATDVEATTARVAHARAALATARATRDHLLAQGARAAALVGLEHHLRRLRDAIDAARGEQLRAQVRHHGQLDAVDAARERLVLARADREVIERHFAAWRTERHKLAERRED
jgi:hypothetical protein